MARPQKKGLDYFPLDVTMDRTDDDIEILEAKYGVSGFATLIKLYMKIYQDEGYFIKWNEKPSLLLAKRVNVDINLIKGVINDLLEWGIFNKKMFENYHILTSKRIQHTYMEAVKKRKNVEMIESLLLIEKVNDNINLVNSDIYPQSKVKKSKVNKSIKDSPPIKLEPKQEKIPFKEIIDYLNLKVIPHKKRKSPYKIIEANQKPIRTRWNKDKMRLDDFFKAIDNAFTFRMASDKDWSQMSPDIIFNGKMNKRINGDAYQWFYEKQNNSKSSTSIEELEKKYGSDN